MRRRFAIPLIAACGIAPWLWFYPETPPVNATTTLSGVLELPADSEWAGGFSAIDFGPDGETFYLVTDRGHVARGRFQRQADQLSGVSIEAVHPLVDKNGNVREHPHTDSEGLAVDGEGRVFVSFEGAHRVLYYSDWDAPARWPSYTRSWRALETNGGLEALAVDAQGGIYTLPEAIAKGATEALVYRWQSGSNWAQPFTIPVESAFSPVGADFGPDGKLYLLERGFYPFGFLSRVRRMAVLPDGVADSEIILQTPLARHGNLEGLAVWADDQGAIRLTMVSDNNFWPFMRSEIVEYVLDAGVAPPAQ